MRDIEMYQALIRSNFPQLDIQTVQPITRGWDSFVLEVNGALIFRFPLRDDVVVPFQREMLLLPGLESTLSVPVPHVTYIGQGDSSYPYTFTGYPKLNGLALEDERITPEQLALLAPAVAHFLNELHAFPTVRAVQASVESHTPEQWRERYLERYTDLRQRVFPLLDAELRARSARLWENFLEEEAHFVFQPALIHCDLACEHIFCDPERGVLTGVIDWGDVTIGDPALDFVGLHGQHGRAFVERVLTGYRGAIDAAFWRRIAFYLCYGPFAQLLYGVYSESEEFIAQGVAGLHALFPR